MCPLLLDKFILVTASTFSTEKINVNNYMTRSNYKSTYRRYIINKYDDNGKYKDRLKFYMDDNGILSDKANDSRDINAGFTDGGFISRREYLLTVPENGTSYLYDGSTYWTLTCNNESKKCFVIEYTGALDQSGISEYLNYTTSPNIRSKATEFVKKDTKVIGTGKKNDPWIFVPKYKVKITVSDKNKAKIKDGSEPVEAIDNIYLSGRCTGEGCFKTVDLILTEGYKYLSNDCDGSYNETTKKFTVSNISKDIECTINVGTGKFKVTLGDKSYDLKKDIYLRHKENFYSDSGYTNILYDIKKLNDGNLPYRYGYKFLGYFISNPKTKIIDETGKVIDKVSINKDKELLVSDWEALKVNVNFDANGGNITSGKDKLTLNFGDNYKDFPEVSKTGYLFEGWYTEVNGGTKVTSDISINTVDEHTLYAHWTPRVYTVMLDNQSATTSGTKTAYMKYNTGWYSNAGATTSMSIITMPTKTEYTFEGYYTEKSGGTQIIDSSGAILSGNTTIFNDTSNKGTLYARWKVICKDNEYFYEGNCHALAKEWTTPGQYDYEIPKSGYYKLEAWGAQGGYGEWGKNRYRTGGLGGYTAGEKYFTVGTMLNIYVGGSGSNGYNKKGGLGGYNGGGTGGSSPGVEFNAAGGGGGASDIRINGIAYSNRIIVAGGGGGGNGGGYEVPNGLSGNYYYDKNNSSNTLGIGSDGSNGSGGGGGGGGGYYGGKAGYYRKNVIDPQKAYGGTYYFSNDFLNIIVNPDSKEGNGKIKLTYIGSTPSISNKNESYTTPGIYMYTVPVTGNYNIELWGASGGGGLWGSRFNHSGGKGGYTKGTIHLSKNTNLFVFVGGTGGNGYGRNGGKEGFNGGGKGGFCSDPGSGTIIDNNGSPGGGGGGASDIRLNGINYNNRIIVAGGGSGGTGGGGEAPNGLPGNKYSGSTNSSGNLGVGGNGISTSGGPGGGGGGFYGGKSEQRNVGQGYGGTYYISNSFSNTEIGVGYKSGNGQVKITFVQ